MLKIVLEIISNHGLTPFQERAAAYGIVSVLLVILCIVVTYTGRKIFVKGFTYAVRKSRNQLDDVLLDHKFFHRLAHIFPAVIMYLSAPVLPAFEFWIHRVSLAYITLVGIRIGSAFMSALADVSENSKNFKRLPVRTYTQVAKIFMYIMGFIFIFSVILDKSPWGFISGIGAMSAIVLLIFKDAILGLVAGVQLSSNRMVRVGDWIEMP